MLLYDRNIIGAFSEIFGNPRYTSENVRKMFGNVRLIFGKIWENLRKSSETGWKSSENLQKRRDKYVYYINTILHARLWI